MHTGDDDGGEGREADGKEERLISTVKKSMLLMVLVAVFLPLDITPLITLAMASLYILKRLASRLLGY